MADSSMPQAALRLVILDMDGVLYRGDQPVAGAAGLTRRLRDAGLLVRYATNNSMFTRAQYVERLAKMGIASTAEEIVTSTSATIEFLHRHVPGVRTVLAIGAQGMVDELRGAGFVVHSVGDLVDAGDPPAVDAVLVGLDPEFDARRRDVAAAAIQHGARFVATNADARYPTPSGFRPGAGAMVAALAKASGASPLVIGKPERAMFAAILESTGVRPDEALMVGDNPDSDIAGAHRAGIPSLLVLTGVTDAESAAALDGDRRPDRVVSDPDAAWAVIAGRIRRERVVSP